DSEIANRQQAGLRNIVKECKDRMASLKSQKNKQDVQPHLHEASESFQQRHIDKAHGQFIFLAKMLDRASSDETTKLRLLGEELASLDAKLTQAPNSAGVTTLRQRRQDLANSAGPMANEGKLDDIHPLLARLIVDVSLELEGDDAPYVKLGR